MSEIVGCPVEKRKVTWKENHHEGPIIRTEQLSWNETHDLLHRLLQRGAGRIIHTDWEEFKGF